MFWTDMTLIQTCFLFAIALFSGGLNSVAGGSGLITFPALLLTGMSPVTANATGTVAALPGLIAAIKAYQTDLRAIER